MASLLQHMLRGGINPIVTVLDCSNAFYKCKFFLLFKRLLDKGLPPVVIRELAYIYMEQYGWVKWGDSKSRQMAIYNGTRQGAILSPKFPLTPMGVLALGSAHARPSAQPPIDVRGNFPARVSA